jgi:hypothetical protein
MGGPHERRPWTLPYRFDTYQHLENHNWAYCLLFRLEAVSEGNLDGIYVTHRVRDGIYSIQWAKEFVVWFNSGAWTTFPFEPLLPAL